MTSRGKGKLTKADKYSKLKYLSICATYCSRVKTQNLCPLLNQ